MISAKEAREQTEYILTVKDKNELTSIENHIKIAMAKGLYSITEMGSLPKIIIKTLEELNYKVKQTCEQYNEDYFTISW